MKKLLAQTVILTSIIIAFFAVSGTAHAGVNHNVSGWGWSDTVGWISLNCTTTPTGCGVDYGVHVDTTPNSNTLIPSGNMSGYAWSPNIGWISFNSSDTSTCPSSPCAARVDLTTGTVTGWAKALAGNPASGWDGWIRLGGNGLTMNTTTGALTGYSWGSTVVGWISWNGIVTQGGPALTLTPDQTQLATPGPVNLTWTSANVQPASCSASWTAQTAASGMESVQVNQTTTFTITCMGNNSAPITATATVTVTSTTSLVLQANPMAVQSNNAVTDLTWTSPTQTQFAGCTRTANPTASGWGGPLPGVFVPNSTNGYTHSMTNIIVPVSQSSVTYTLTCTDTLGNQAIATAIVTVFAPTPSISLAANPANLPQGGGTSNLSWNAGNVTSCAASANPSGWSGSKSPSGGMESVSVTTTTMFTITCQSPYSPSQVSASTTVYVAGSPPCSTCSPQPPPKPVFEEF